MVGRVTALAVLPLMIRRAPRSCEPGSACVLAIVAGRPGEQPVLAVTVDRRHISPPTFPR
jgi:hypothetical protein